MSTLPQTIPLRSRPRPGARTRRAPVRQRRSRFQGPVAHRLHVPAVARRLDRSAGYYAAGLVVLTLLVLYLLQAAQVTAAGYRIERLQSQQTDLLAEQAQLRYEEASLQAPSRVQSEAASTGMQRVAPVGYVQYRGIALDLSTQADATVGSPPIWAKLLAGLGFKAA